MVNSTDLLKEVSSYIEHQDDMYLIYLNNVTVPFAKFEFKNKSANNGPTVKKLDKKSIFEIFKVLHKEANVTYLF